MNGGYILCRRRPSDFLQAACPLRVTQIGKPRAPKGEHLLPAEGITRWWSPVRLRRSWIRTIRRRTYPLLGSCPAPGVSRTPYGFVVQPISWFRSMCPGHLSRGLHRALRQRTNGFMPVVVRRGPRKGLRRTGVADAIAREDLPTSICSPVKLHASHDHKSLQGNKSGDHSMQVVTRPSSAPSSSCLTNGASCDGSGLPITKNRTTSGTCAAVLQQ